MILITSVPVRRGAERLLATNYKRCLFAVDECVAAFTADC